MKLDTIYAELNRVKEIFDGWRDGGINDLEKDIALDKLRNIYQEIKFAETVNVHGEIILPEMGILDLSGPITEHKSDSDGGEVEVAEQITEEAAPIEVIVPEPLGEVVAGEGVTEQVAEEIVAEGVTEEVTEEVAPEQPADQHLFDVTKVQSKPAVDRRVILSLYGDELAEVASKPQENPLQEEAMPSAISEDEPASDKDTSESDSLAGKVIGEVISNGGQVLGDVISHTNYTNDLASKIASEGVTELHKAIGINDKFLMVRDLFGGDTDKYDAAINEFEGFDNLDDALIHMHENYRWNPNSEGVKLLVELLTRKFS